MSDHVTPPATGRAEPRAESGSPGPRIGVVVITRDRRARLLDSLARLVALPERPPVVVVDNASTDGTAAAVRERFPQLRVVRMRRNRGAAGRTVGTALLGTPYAAFSDDDSWWRPGALGEAVRIFDRHPRLGLLAAATRVGVEEQPDPIDELLAGSPLGTAPDLPGPSVLGFLACAAVVRTGPFLATGGFHPLFQVGGEEMLVALDLTAAGLGVAYCPQIVAHHHPDAAPRPGRQARMRRNELLTALLRRPWPVVAEHAGRLLRDAVHDRHAARALLSVPPRLPVALWQRRMLPPGVEQAARLLEQPEQPDPWPDAPVPTVGA